MKLGYDCCAVGTEIDLFVFISSNVIFNILHILKNLFRFGLKQHPSKLRIGR